MGPVREFCIGQWSKGQTDCEVVEGLGLELRFNRIKQHARGYISCRELSTLKN